MTYGTVNNDYTFPIKNGNAGFSFYKTWSGGDRTSTNRPQKPQAVPPFHEYAGNLNLSRFKGRQKLSVLKDVYDRWRAARDSYGALLKDYHVRKAEWQRSCKTEMHPYSMQLVSVRHGRGKYWNNPGNWGSEDASLSGTFGWYQPSANWDSNDQLALIRKIQEQLDGGIGFHTGVALAETERTFQMIRDNAKKFRRIGEELASRNLPGALRVAFNGSSAHNIRGFDGLRGIADNYLLYQFGVKPLVHDVLDGARSYGYKAARPKFVRIHVKRQKRVKGIGPPHGSWQQAYDCSVNGQIVCYLTAENLGVESGLLDVPSILWERSLYSFVVDWWIDIGGYLKALHVNRTISNTTFCETRTDRYWSGPITSGKIYTIESDFGGEYKSIRVNRTIGGSLTVPFPSMKPLFHKDSEVSLRHTLEALALIVQKAPLLKKVYKDLSKASESYTD